MVQQMAEAREQSRAPGRASSPEIGGLSLARSTVASARTDAASAARASERTAGSGRSPPPPGARGPRRPRRARSRPAPRPPACAPSPTDRSSARHQRVGDARRPEWRPSVHGRLGANARVGVARPAATATDAVAEAARLAQRRQRRRPHQRLVGRRAPPSAAPPPPAGRSMPSARAMAARASPVKMGFDSAAPSAGIADAY